MSAEASGLPCIACNSSDAMARYEDNSGYCFSCHNYFPPSKFEEDVGQDDSAVMQKSTKASKERDQAPWDRDLSSADVPQRGLTKATLDFFGVKTEHSVETGEVTSLVYPLFREGEAIGVKEKVFEGKRFIGYGDCKNPDFFGANKVAGARKLLVVTEGEDDCMAVHQMLARQGKDYAVVSLPNGANASSARKRLEWLESFETVILNLDNDDVGKECAQEIADVLSPGKVKIMSLPVKDANDMLLSGPDKSREYLSALMAAKPYRPDGVIALSDSWDLMWSSENQKSIPYPWVGVNSLYYGIRPREIVTFTAGTGVGKSAVMRELEHWMLIQTEDNIGVLSLEESVARTAWGILSVEANLPLSIREHREGVSQDDIREWFDATLGTDRYFTLDHFGSTSEDNLLSKIRYMIKGLGCKWIVLDHLSIVVSAMENGGDERKSIDSIMTKLRQMVEETDVGLFLVSHLKRVDGNRGHEQGIEVSLSHLRGSQAIAQLSDAVIALERDQQAEDPKMANLTTVRGLKNRYAGLTGVCSHLAYNRDTGRLTEIMNIGEYLAPSVQETGY